MFFLQKWNEGLSSCKMYLLAIGFFFGEQFRRTPLSEMKDLKKLLKDLRPSLGEEGGER